MDARPGGPTAKRKPSPRGWGSIPKNDLSAVSAALNLSPHALVSLEANSGFPATLHQSMSTYAALFNESRTSFTDATKLYRNPEEAEGPAVLLLQLRPLSGAFFDRANPDFAVLKPPKKTTPHHLYQATVTRNCSSAGASEDCVARRDRARWRHRRR
jgi:hypothetical protein